jgi:hypothetical protein
VPEFCIKIAFLANKYLLYKVKVRWKFKAFFMTFFTGKKKKFELDRTFEFVCLNLNVGKRTIFTNF